MNRTDSNSTLQRAGDLYDKKEYRLAIEHLNQLSGKEQGQVEATKLRALSCFYLHQYPEAERHFRRLLTDEGDSAQMWFNILSCCIDQGKYSECTIALEKIKRLKSLYPDSKGPNYTYSCLYYMDLLAQKGELDLAKEYLELAKDIYGKLTITDPTFLYIRGLPGFDILANSIVKIALNTMSRAEATAWIQSLRKSLDDEGQRNLDAALKYCLDQTRHRT